MIKYDMTFQDVLNEIFDTKGWYQGEGFDDGVFITTDEDGNTIKTKEFDSDTFYGEMDWGNFSLTRGTVGMKYRRCYTQPDIERKCK